MCLCLVSMILGTVPPYHIPCRLGTMVASNDNQPTCYDNAIGWGTTYRKDISHLAIVGLKPWWYWLYDPSTIQHGFQWCKHQNIHQNSLFQWHTRWKLWPSACQWCRPMYKKQLLSGWFHMEPPWYTRGNSSFPWKLGENVFPGLVFVQTMDDITRQWWMTDRLQ